VSGQRLRQRRQVVPLVGLQVVALHAGEVAGLVSAADHVQQLIHAAGEETGSPEEGVRRTTSLKPAKTGFIVGSATDLCIGRLSVHFLNVGVACLQAYRVDLLYTNKTILSFIVIYTTVQKFGVTHPDNFMFSMKMHFYLSNELKNE